MAMEIDPNEIDTQRVVAKHILYVVVLPGAGAGEFSPFQGFSANSFSVLNAIEYICTLPATIDELFLTRDEALRMRSIGLNGYAIVLFERGSLHKFRGGLPFTCIVSDVETREEVERHIADKGRKEWLHLTTDESESAAPKLWESSRAHISQWAHNVAEAAIAKKSGGSAPANLSWRAFVPWPEEPAHLDTRLHNITRPTEMVFRSLHFVLGQASKPLALSSDEDFALGISTAADALERVRHEAMADQHRIPGSPTLIVTVPSVYRHLSSKQLRREATPATRKVFRHMLRQRQYIAMRASGVETKEMLEDRTAAALLAVRGEELAAYTTALSISAASLGVPVLRCPPQVDRVRELLIRLAGISRSNNPNVERRNRIAHEIGLSLRSAIPKPLLERIENHQHEGIKIIGDTPLELLPVNGLPLGLQATVSRLPTLPGNLLMRHSLMRTPLLLRAADLMKVLIVRAFDRDDPLRNVLVEAIQMMNSESATKIDLQVVDVATKDEFVTAFNDFDGIFAIFDGHGSHERTEPQGTIRVGAIGINPFELYGKIKIPPILFLSACETHTLEGIESSVASAFLLMGARSVLGTIVPIDGLKAAILMGRFILRFTDFIPLLRTMISWSQVVGGMLRMSYVTEVLRAFEKTHSLAEDDYRKIHTAANITINQFEPRWFEQVLTSVSEAISVPETRVRDEWLRKSYFTDTMHYVHLGQPEHMFIVPENIDDED
jgi:hypothetical protein